MLQPTVPAWFEIPTANLDRAVRFYETLVDAKLKTEQFGPKAMAIFPHDEKQPSGALIQADDYKPSPQGTVLYLNLDDIRPALARVAKAGGEVLLPLTQLPNGGGVFAELRDSEGNRVGVYSRT